MGRPWTREEIEYISNGWGEISIPNMAKRLDRSVEAVKLKGQRIGLGRFIHSGRMVTFCQFIRAYGCTGSYSWIREKWAENGFPFHTKKAHTMKYLMVDIDEFWKWAEEHQNIVDFSHFEENSIGAEPPWAKEKRKRDKQEQRNTRPWTKMEDDRLRHMLDAQKYNLDQIAAELNRREGAIRRRIATLGIMDRPVRNPGKWWTETEIDEMVQMHREGHTWEAIGEKLGRTASACRGRYERHMNPDAYRPDVLRNKTALREYWQRNQCVHYSRALGCELRGTNCDTCNAYEFRQPGAAETTGWISTKVGHEGSKNIRRSADV